jgi:hypothetical protein
MPHRRKAEKGSFAAHFDELVAHFPPEAKRSTEAQRAERSRELQDKVDVHAALFERAWKLEHKP